MKSSTILIACVLMLVAPVAEAKSPLSFADGVVRLEGMATGGVITSLWADDKSLYVTFPAKKKVRRRSIKTEHKIIRKVRLRRFKGRRAQVELVLRRPAGVFIQRVRVHELNGDLLIALREGAAAAPVPPAVAGTDTGKKKEAAGKTATAGAKEKKVATKAGAEGKKSKPAVTDKKRGAAGLLAGKRRWGKNKKGILGKPSGKEPGPSLATFWVLFLFVGLGGGVAWWLKRRKRGSALGDANIDIVSCKPLSGKHRLLLVDANNELLLLGCTDRDIRLLRVMGPAKNQQDLEKDWFAPNDDGQHVAGADNYLLDESRELPPVGYPPVEVPRESRKTGMSSFMAQLTQQIQQRQDDRGSDQQEMEAEPLDERWAEGIIKLRKARRTGANGANGRNGSGRANGSGRTNGSNGTSVDLLH